ncbi:nuclear transport factor 2 family protein [Novimethylophilus kurashikiensis]|nr:tetratricopeptide repeat protein [Novimethylophilus kurashikiensis]
MLELLEIFGLKGSKLLEFRNRNFGKKYSIMTRLRTPLLSLLLFAALGFPLVSHADELKDISQLMGQEQYSQALDKVNAYLAAHPKDVAAQFLKGVVLAEQNKSAEAIKIFTDITEKHPELPEPYNNLAVIYAEQGQYDKARISLEKAIKTHPSYATAHENLGDIYAKMASDAYDKALQLDRSNSRAQTKLMLVKELFSRSAVVASSGVPAKPTPTPVMPTLSSPVVAVAPSQPPAPPAVNPPLQSAVVAKAEEPAKPKVEPVQASADKASSKDKAPDATSMTVEKSKSVTAKEEAKVSKEDQSKNNAQEALLRAVHGWAKAWSARDVDAYLAYYAKDFKTPNGESRSEWEKMRRERIRKPASIQVEVLNPKVSIDGNHATIAFKQSYRAGINSMRTSKTLVFVKMGEKWLITQELANH